jgi:hypothetical protein
VSALAGAMVIIVGPVEPAMDRLYIGRTFCVVVLAGLGSMTGTLGAGLILGISESIVLMMVGASWRPPVAFGLLLVVLGISHRGCSADDVLDFGSRFLVAAFAAAISGINEYVFLRRLHRAHLRGAGHRLEHPLAATRAT